MKDYITLLAAILTPTLAIIGTFLAVQQWRINDRKLKHDLYDRRLPLYTALMRFLTKIGQEAKASDEEISDFLQKTRESHFLFDDEVRRFLEEIYKGAIDLRYHNTMLHAQGSSLPIGDERTRIAKENSELLKWFNAQFESARNKFTPYLRLS
jgi:hypothetical protein